MRQQCSLDVKGAPRCDRQPLLLDDMQQDNAAGSAAARSTSRATQRVAFFVAGGRKCRKLYVDQCCATHSVALTSFVLASILGAVNIGVVVKPCPKQVGGL